MMKCSKMIIFTTYKSAELYTLPWNYEYMCDPTNKSLSTVYYYTSWQSTGNRASPLASKDDYYSTELNHRIALTY